jgi:hypothetical protein
MGAGLLPYKLQGPARLICPAWVGYTGPVFKSRLVRLRIKGKNKLFCINCNKIWRDVFVNSYFTTPVCKLNPDTQVNSDCYKERLLELEYC